MSLAQFFRHLAATLAGAVADLFAANPALFTALAATALIVVVVRRRPRCRTTDPRRLFTANQKDRARALAGGRCEMDGWFGARCRRDGAHADHWIPWVRGGATSDTNLVWACRTHNLRKSSRMPSRLQTARITRRRARYFPPGAARRPGDRYRPADTRTELSHA